MSKIRTVGIAVLVAAAGLATVAQGQLARTEQPSYVRPTNPLLGVRILPIISNGNGTGGMPAESYQLLDFNDVVVPGQTLQLLGIPDGMGAYDNGDGTFTLIVNHELGATSSTVHAHGSRGSTITRWVIAYPSGAGRGTQASDFTVIGGRDGNVQYNLYTINEFTRVEGGVSVTYPAGSWVPFNTTFPMPAYNQGATFGVQGWDFNNPSRNGTGRYCSADLAPTTAFQWTDPSTGTVFGTAERIYLNGEEIGSGGRALAHVLTGPEKNQAFELPRLGHISWENSLASPFAQRKTIVIGMDDSGDGNLVVYVGAKQTTGRTIDRAGLTNGTLYGVAIPDLVGNAETNAFAIGSGVLRESAPFTLYNFGDVSNVPGATIGTGPSAIPGLQQIGNANQVTNFLRPEDGQWDPINPNVFYFVTTNNVAAPSRLWKLVFTDITQPELGGQITMLGDSLNPASFAGGFNVAPTPDRSAGDATPGGVNAQGAAIRAEMFDNFGLDVTSDGDVILLIQEDPGSLGRLARTWVYNVTTDSLTDVAYNDIRFFGRTTWPVVGGAVTNFLTTNEETSGAIPLPFLGRGWWVTNMQAHYGISGELVEGGQIQLMHIPECPGDWNGDGTLEPADIAAFYSDYRGGRGDFNGDGECEPLDVQMFFDAYRNGGC